MFQRVIGPRTPSDNTTYQEVEKGSRSSTCDARFSGPRPDWMSNAERSLNLIDVIFRSSKISILCHFKAIKLKPQFL